MLDSVTVSMGEDTSRDFSESFLVTLILTDIAIAMFDSVTVSLGEDTSGVSVKVSL